jgi:hypothetical protein
VMGVTLLSVMAAGDPLSAKSCPEDGRTVACH